MPLADDPTLLSDKSPVAVAVLAPFPASVDLPNAAFLQATIEAFAYCVRMIVFPIGVPALLVDVLVLPICVPFAPADFLLFVPHTSLAFQGQKEHYMLH